MELEFVAEFDADPLRPQQFQNWALILELGAGRITEGVARAAIALPQQLAGFALVAGKGRT